jgi:hypothetical protein
MTPVSRLYDVQGGECEEGPYGSRAYDSVGLLWPKI